MQFSRWFGVRWKAFICFVLVTLKLKACLSQPDGFQQKVSEPEAQAGPRQGSWSCWALALFLQMEGMAIFSFRDRLA